MHDARPGERHGASGTGWPSRRPPVASEERIITLNMGLQRDSLAMLALIIEVQLVAEGRPPSQR